jgi:hypothetical protein
MEHKMTKYGSSRIKTIIIKATGGTGPIGEKGPTGNTGAYVTGPTGLDGIGLVNVSYDALTNRSVFLLSDGKTFSLNFGKGPTGIGPAPSPLFLYAADGISPIGNTANIDTGYTLQFRGIKYSTGICGSVSGNSIILRDNNTATGSFNIGKLLEVEYSNTNVYYLDSADDVNYENFTYSGISYSNLNVTRTYVRDTLDSSNFNYIPKDFSDTIISDINFSFYGVTGVANGLTYSSWTPFIRYSSSNYDSDNLAGTTQGLITFSRLGPYNVNIKPEELIGSCCYCDEKVEDLDDKRKCIDYVSKTYCESVFGRWSQLSCLQRLDTYDCFRRRACCVNGLCINTSKAKCEQMNGVFDSDNECGASYDCERKFFGSPPPPPPEFICCCVNCVPYPNKTYKECVALGGTPLSPADCAGLNCCDYSNLGACCLPSGRCELLSPKNCSLNSGVYLGTGTTCGKNSCYTTTT